MGSVRKHVHDPGCGQRETVLLNQHAGIARQSSGMTGHVHDARRPRCSDQPQDLLRTGAGRIQQYLVVAPPRPDASVQIFRPRDWRVKNSTLRIPLRCAFCRARATRPASPSTPTTCCATRASGREKLPSPQNKSSTVSCAPGCSSSTTRATMRSLSSPLTWMKSVGWNCRSTSNCGNPISQRRRHRLRNGATVS